MPSEDPFQANAAAESTSPLAQSETTQTRPAQRDLSAAGRGWQLARLSAVSRAARHREIPGGGTHR